MSPLARFPTTPDDPLLSKRLMESWYNGETYTCPKCNHQEPDPFKFRDHIQKHLDEFISEGPLPLSRTPPPPGYDLTREPPVRPEPIEGSKLPEPSRGIHTTKP